jgi:hypothetical protein
MVRPSADHFLPGHKTNFSVLPVSHSKPSLDVWPSFCSFPLLNNSNKWSWRLGGWKDEYLLCNLCFCVQKIILNTSTSPAVLFHTDQWSNTTHNRPNLPRLVHSRCERPGEVSLCWANAHLGLFFVVECESQHHHPFPLVSIADKQSKNHSRPIKSTLFSLFEVHLH